MRIHERFDLFRRTIHMTKNIGEFLKETRKNKGFTQKELADRIGVSDKTISKWEIGNSMPDTSMLLPLCTALDITINEFLSCERISPEEYSMKAEENIMALIEENKRTKKENGITRGIGIAVLLLGLCLMAISNAGLSFPILDFVDMPSFLILLLLDVGIVLISGAKTKEKIISLLSKTLLPVGGLVAIVSCSLLLYNLDDLSKIGPNLAIVFLTLLYSAIAKIVVEILAAKE